MKLSIVIPCKDDIKILDCLDSIDEKVETVIVFNGSKTDFIRTVKTATNNKSSLNLKFLTLPEANLSWALQTGVLNSTYDWILFIDSDCVFKKEAIRAFYNTMLKGNPSKEVYKGEIVFRNSKRLISKIIAESRQHHTAGKLTAYKPPLAVSKRIENKIGGYFFDKRLKWREDSDLDNRIRIASISIIPVPNGVIYHGPISLKTDLRSTFRYGIGGSIADSLGIKLTEVPHSFRSTILSKGIYPAVYMLFRNRFYTAGCIYQKLKILLSKIFHGENYDRD